MLQQAKAIYAWLLPVPVVGPFMRVLVRLYKFLTFADGRGHFTRQETLESAVAALRTDVDLLQRSLDRLKSDIDNADKKCP